jgi:non-homologous end joining protein Ku
MKGDNHLLAVTTTKDEIGQIKPLFAFPIQICKAVDEKEVKFDIAAPSGAPRKQQYVDSATGEVCTDDQCQRGIRVGDEFRPIAQEQIDQIDQATKLDTLIVVGSVPVDEIPFDRATGTYFLQSPVKGGSPKAYRLVYEALSAGKRALVTKRTARTRQKLCLIYADDAQKCLMLVEVRFAAQLRQPDEQVLAPQLATVEQAQIDKALQVIENLGDGLVALNEEADAAVSMRQGLIEQALNGDELSIPVPVASTIEADSLEDLLEASLAQVG